MKNYIVFISILFSSAIWGNDVAPELSRPYSPKINSKTNDIPQLFVDPSCRACSELINELQSYPDDAYQLILVSAVPPTMVSFSQTLWHLSSGGGLPEAQTGCQISCASRALIHNEPFLSKLYVDSESKVLDSEKKPIKDASGRNVYWLSGQGFINSDKQLSRLGRALFNSENEQIEWDKDASKSDRLYVGALQLNEDGALIDTENEHLYYADIYVSAIDLSNRIARLAINSRKMHQAAEVSNTPARVPSALVNGKYVVIDSPEALNKIIGDNENVAPSSE